VVLCLGIFSLRPRLPVKDDAESTKPGPGREDEGLTPQSALETLNEVSMVPAEAV
jgi:hypothetical protein